MCSALLALILAPSLLLAACTSDTTPQDQQDTSPALTDDSPAGDSGIAARAAREDLAQRLNVDANDIAVEKTEAREWSDSCLGLGGPAESCLAVITPGFAMTLVHNGTEYVYRTNPDGTAVRAE
jgi:hypothetical protein